MVGLLCSTEIGEHVYIQITDTEIRINPDKDIELIPCHLYPYDPYPEEWKEFNQGPPQRTPHLVRFLAAEDDRTKHIAEEGCMINMDITNDEHPPKIPEPSETLEQDK